jgi:NAD(P)-dependent dehydrogenase (short-subunit alcohol dehydrogenase family)
MKDQGAGVIINISSTAGLYGLPFRTPYAAAKWGVIGFTKSLAAEVGRWNIRVNAICPGAVEGPRMERVIAAEAQASGRSADAIRDDYTKGVSLKRFVRPEEIADMALFLASPAAAMMSGQAIAVDGHTETFHSE